MQNAYRTQLYLPTFSQSGNPNRKQILRCEFSVLQMIRPNRIWFGFDSDSIRFDSEFSNCESNPNFRFGFGIESESELIRFDSFESNPNRIRISRIRIESESNRIESNRIESESNPIRIGFDSILIWLKLRTVPVSVPISVLLWLVRIVNA